MPTFTWTPDREPARDVDAKVLSAPFGDRYTQEVPDGLNNMAETWDLEFSVRSLTEIKAIEDFLAAQMGASPFTWTTPRGDTLNFTCKKWKSRYRTVTDNSLTCTFTQDFRL